MTDSSSTAEVIIKARGAARLHAGHVWVYRSDVVSTGDARPGALVRVGDERGKFLGEAFYSSASQIALRLLSRAEIVEPLADLIARRIQDAVEYRKDVVQRSNAYRVVFSEADSLPGLIVDRYNDIVSLQVLTQAMDQQANRKAIVDSIQQLISPESICERVDPRIRQLENLPLLESGLRAGEKTKTSFSSNGLSFAYDALAGQKTGAFLDQRENYAAAETYAHGSALDVFCYHGGFALHLARACEQVTGVDSSRPSLEAAEHNATLNQNQLRCEIEWMEANAFDLMKDYARAHKRYDTIVLDPPAFAKSKASLPAALRGYKELNLRALQMLRPGGVLVTCSCSQAVTEADFLATVASAAADAGRPLRILERRSQARDHPVSLTIPETGYLKCIILEISQ